jgi:hypothetical protein
MIARVKLSLLSRYNIYLKIYTMEMFQMLILFKLSRLHRDGQAFADRSDRSAHSLSAGTSMVAGDIVCCECSSHR